MERFTDRFMKDEQVTEVVELINGEHGDSLALWGARNQRAGCRSGLITGALYTVLGSALTVGALSVAKAFVKTYMDNRD